MDTKVAIQHYCNYQERCHSEVRNKLYDLGCKKNEVEEHIAELIASGTVNEQRYACAYARGKFRIKHWGREKIKQHLRLKKISEYCVKKSFDEINEEEYEKVLRGLAERKWKELKSEKNVAVKRSKACRYLLQKGYEYYLVEEIIKDIIINEKA
jgi:regulatory protein